MNRLFILVGAVALTGHVSPLAADVINVPANYPTIQLAIDAAINGDEIIVAPGTYVENITLAGKTISLKSSSGPAVTTLVPESPGTGPAFLSPGSLVLDSANDRVLIADRGAFTMYEADLPTGNRAIISSDSVGSGPSITNCEGNELDTNANRGLAIHRVPNAALYGINLTNGDRSLISGPGMGSGTAFSQIEAVQFDAANNRALITDSGLNAVFGVDLATGARTVLSSPTVGTGPNTQSARDIVYNPAANTAYVFAHLTFTTTPAIYEIDLNTGNRSILSDPTHGTGPDFLFSSGLALNVASNEVFAMDGNLRAVFSVDLNTGNRTIISQNGGPGVGIDFFSPWDIEYDAANNRVLVVDLNLDALIGVDLATGDRTTISRLSNQANVKVELGEGVGTTIEGFTITGAQLAGAIRLANATNLEVRNCVFESNHKMQNGGAIDVTNGASLTAVDCVFSENSAGNAGGAIFVAAGQSSIERCRFAENTAGLGGAIYVGGAVTCQNSMMSGNAATTNGGAVFIAGLGSFKNCTIEGNTTGSGVIENSVFTSTMTNCIVRNNAPLQADGDSLSIMYCNVEGIAGGSGNIDLAPLYADADGVDNVAGTIDDDFRLLAASPGIDAGDSDALESCGLDLADNDRRVDDPATTDSGLGFAPPVDIGAYEFGSEFFDCNNNGILDACEGIFYDETSDVLAPIGEDAPQMWTFPAVPDAGESGVTLVFSAIGDFGHAIEYLDIRINDMLIGSVFIDDGNDCPAEADHDELAVDAATFNALVSGGDAEVKMEPSVSVSANPIGCASSVRVRLAYQAVTAEDANGDGVPDSCACAGDTNGDSIVDVTDLLAVLAAWGTCAPPCAADTNADGIVDITDLLTVLGAWGPCS